MQARDQHIAIHIDKKLADLLRQAADEDSRSVSSYGRQAIEQKLASDGWLTHEPAGA